MENNDLWPSFEGLPQITSPRAILAEQANYLAQRTKNLLNVNLKSGNSANKPGKLYIHFKIVAPLLNNYTYHLFTIYHDAFLYPCELKYNSNIIICNSEEELKAELKEIFNKSDTIRVIGSLLSQSSELEQPKVNNPFEDLI